MERDTTGLRRWRSVVTLTALALVVIGGCGPQQGQGWLKDEQRGQLGLPPKVQSEVQPKGREAKEDELRRQLEEYADPCKVMGIRIETVCARLLRNLERYNRSSSSMRAEIRTLDPLLDGYLTSGRQEFLQDPTYRLLSDYLAWLKGERRRRGEVKDLDPYDGDNMQNFIRTFY